MTQNANIQFRACDTTWRIGARGRRAEAAVRAARSRVLDLERVLNAFDPESAVGRLNREGKVRDPHVAAIVRRAEEYRELTRGAFDIVRGELEQSVKAYIRGELTLLPGPGEAARHRVEGDTVWTSAPLDLNGIAKGYIVDQAAAVLAEHGALGFVDGGGDIATPTGPVGIESPGSGGRFVGVLDTNWNIATSGGHRRRRRAADHLYDPRTGRVGSRHDQVTVVARRDCVEADVLATTLAVLPLSEGKALVRALDGVEALWVCGSTLLLSAGFGDHVWKP